MTAGTHRGEGVFPAAGEVVEPDMLGEAGAPPSPLQSKVKADGGEGEDPRVPFTPPGMNAWEITKIFFFTVTLLAPLRLVLIALLLCSLYPLSLLGPERFGRVAPPVYRAILFSAGFHIVRRERRDGGALAEPVDARHPAVAVANHVSLYDSLLVLMSQPVAIMAKREVFGIPGIGRLLKASRSVPVDRSTPEGRRAAVRAIVERGEDEASLLIFPQGTTTLPTRLTPFKRGAFLRGEVRPYAIVMDHYLTLGIEHGMFTIFYWSLCQPWNNVTVIRLPDMVADTERGETPEAFGERVRQALCEALPDCRLSEATMEEALEARRAYGSLHAPQSTAVAIAPAGTTTSAGASSSTATLVTVPAASAGAA